MVGETIASLVRFTTFYNISYIFVASREVFSEECTRSGVLTPRGYITENSDIVLVLDDTT